MNILPQSTLSLALAIVVMSLSYASPSFAAPKKCDNAPKETPGCGGGTEGGNNACDIKFSVTFDDAGSDAVRSDNNEYPVAGGEYPDPGDSKDKSGAFTGKGPGLRFDTNGIGPLLSNHDKRLVHVDVQPTGPTIGGIDFRFHQNTGGLPLCDMAPNTTTSVAMTLRYDNSAGDEFVMLYDCIHHSGARIDFVGNKVDVIRGSEAGAAVGTWEPGNTWTLVGTTACVQTVNDHATGSDVLLGNPPVVAAGFLITIEAQ